MPLLSVKDLTMRFGGLTAVNSVSFEVHAHEIFSIIGPNGAGKTTVFNAITGIYSPSEGEILLESKSLQKTILPKDIFIFLLIGCFTSLFLVFMVNIQSLWTATIEQNYIYQASFPWAKALHDLLASLASLEFRYGPVPAFFGGIIGIFGAVRIWLQFRRTPEYITGLGISRTFQNIRLFRDMTVIENVMMSMREQVKAPFYPGFFKLRSEKKCFLECETAGHALLKFVELDEKAHSLAGNLPYGYQRRLEIARALATKPKILLLDEPAAGMNPTESKDLMDLIMKIRESGVTVILIEHHMKVVMGISDRIVVLDYGHKIAEGTPLQIRENKKVIAAYLGERE